MSDRSPSNAPGEEYFNPGAYIPAGHDGPGAPQRPPLSKMAISGFVIACISLIVFGFLGVVGMLLCGRGLREVRTGRARGRGLAIAGVVIGAVAFTFYLVNMFVRTH